jgi:hypothetical protein
MTEVKEPRTIEKEAGFLNKYYPKIAERILIINESMRNGVEISDADLEIMKEVHRWWFEGRFPVMETIVIPDKQIVIQTDLFADKTTDNVIAECSGMEVVITECKPKKKKK